MAKKSKFKQQFYVGEIIRYKERQLGPIYSFQITEVKYIEKVSAWLYYVSTKDIPNKYENAEILWVETKIYLKEGHEADWELIKPVEERLWK